MRSLHRQQESMQNLRAMLKAVRAKNAAVAEETIRAEVHKAAAEVKRLLAKD
jgi:DNA-binding GntR family transcriptional regulator